MTARSFDYPQPAMRNGTKNKLLSRLEAKLNSNGPGSWATASWAATLMAVVKTTI